MDIFSELQNRLKKSGVLIFFIMLFFYFSFYTINGERGIRRYLHLRQEISYATEVAAEYHRQKTDLENKVRLLSSDSLDLDMLDERARTILNLAQQDEFIILDSYEK